MRVGDFILRADSGYSASGEDRATSDGELGVLTLAAVSTGTFRPEKHKAVTGSEVGKLRVFPRRNRILISRSNTPDFVGAVAYVPDDYPNLFLPDLIWQLEPKHDSSVYMPWFCYFLQSSYGRAKIRKIAVGSSSSMVKIGKQSFLNIELSVPPLPEQRKIGAILGTWDSAIGTAEKLVGALQERKQGLMQRLLTGKVRFPDFKYEPWPLVRAGDIFQPFSQRKNDGEELLSVTQDRGVIPRSMLDTRVVMPEGVTDNYKLVEQGDFIISLRSFQGGIEHSGYRGIVSPAYTVLKPKVEIVDGYYKQMFKSAEFIARLSVAIIGIRDGKQINYDDFANIKLPYPSLAEQRRIEQVFATVDEEIALLGCKLNRLQQQKLGLMQRLLTDQVCVRVDADEQG